ARAKAGGAVGRRCRECLWEGGDLLLESHAAVLRVGVRGKPLGNAAAALRLAHAGEHLEDVGHFSGIVVRAPHVAQAEVVRLALVVTRVLEEEHAERLACETGVASELRARNTADGEAELREL